MQAIQVNKEIYTKRDEEAGTTLSPIQSRVETAKYSSDTGSTSKMKEVMEDFA